VDPITGGPDERGAESSTFTGSIIWRPAGVSAAWSPAEKDLLATAYYIRHSVWKALLLRFGFERDDRMDWLFDPAIESQFKALPADFRITTDQMIKLDAQIGAVLLEKARDYLLRDIDKETREIFELEEVERKIDRHTVKKNKPSAAATQIPAPAKEPTVKEFATAVKAWLRCH
jgi:hypothetical protein